MNEIAKQMQSNQNLLIDDSFTVSMNIFKSKQPSMTGRGSRNKEKIKNAILVSFYLIKTIHNLVFLLEDELWCQKQPDFRVLSLFAQSTRYG